LTYGLAASELRRDWRVRDGELDGPIWSITFEIRADLHLKREASGSGWKYGAVAPRLSRL